MIIENTESSFGIYKLLTFFHSDIRRIKHFSVKMKNRRAASNDLNLDICC